MNDSDDESQERIQRILNEYKRKEIAEKYGAQFSLQSNANLPPEVEAQWLDQIDEFERQFANATRIALHEYIGSPSIRPLSNIPTSELGAEFNRLLTYLAEHDVVVDFLHEVEISEAYRFITEELLEEEIDNVRISGMRHHFIYEEFHPNDEDDADIENSL